MVRRCHLLTHQVEIMRWMLIIAGALALLSGCEPKPDLSSPPKPAAITANQHSGWSDFREDFIERYFERFPIVAVGAGRHEFDGRLPDMSPEGIAERLAWLNERRTVALEYSDAELLGTAAFERDYLVAAIDQALFTLDVSGFVTDNPVFYTNAIDPTVYLTFEYAPLPARMAAFVTHAENIPEYLEQMRANLRPPLARPHVQVTKGILDGMREFFVETVIGIFATVSDVEMQERLAAANVNAISALDEALAWLDKQEIDDDFALGEERFLTMLRMTEGVDTTIESLKAAGEADARSNLAKLEKACGIFAPDATLLACVAQVDAKKPEEGPVEGARRQLDDLKEFIIDNRIVSIPGEEEVRVDESPPYKRFNLAYIEIPGPYDAGLPSTYYIAPPDPAWSEQDRLSYLPGRKNLLYISVHEVWPGHFLQSMHASRAESSIDQVAETYSYLEGWAHYSEELMFEAGLDDGDAESHIGQLSNALLRNVRFLSAIGLHTEGMTVDESRQMFEEVGMQDYGNAIQQAQRGTFDPGYLNYTLGKLMIRRLRNEWVASRGGRSAWKDFHDEFLSFGGAPIPLIRSEMLGYAGGGLLPD
jgi:hypothetical protein